MGSLLNSVNATAYLAEFWERSETERQNVLNQLRSRGFSDQQLLQLFSNQSYSQVDHPEVHYMQYPEYRVHKILLLYISPLLLILGTLGNLFCFFILRHKPMKQQSISLYLSTLAIFDSLVLYVGLLRTWVGELTGTDIRNQGSWLCKGIVMLGYSCSDISVWLIIAVTVERYIVVCHPLRVPRYCHELRAKKIILGIVLLFVLINFHFFFSIDVQLEAGGGQLGEGVYKCLPVPGYETLVIVVWPWVDALLYGLGPFVLICVLNSIILVKICQANKTRASLLNGHQPAQRSVSASSESGNLRMTVMLLTVSFTFLLTTLPMNISSIVADIWINKPSSSDAVRSKGILFGTAASLLMYLNHSINFFLYCATGRRFREVAVRVFCDRFRTRTGSTLDHSQHLYCSRTNTIRLVPESLRPSPTHESNV